MANDESVLQALAARIQVTIHETGRCLLTQPAELAPLRALSPGNLHDFAAGHGWTAVPRLGFSQIEFFAVHVPRIAVKPA